MKKNVVYRPTWKNWTKGIAACLLLVAFLIWIRSWLGVVVLPFVFDAYVTKKINCKRI